MHLGSPVAHLYWLVTFSRKRVGCDTIFVSPFVNLAKATTLPGTHKRPGSLLFKGICQVMKVYSTRPREGRFFCLCLFRVFLVVAHDQFHILEVKNVFA